MYSKSYILILIFFLLSLHNFAQQKIIGRFPSMAGQQVKLMGFENFDSYAIDSTQISEDGKFTLRYDEKNFGMGYLEVANNKAYLVVLAKENTQLQGESFNLPKTVTILSGNQNILFAKYASEHPRREQVLSAWNYLAQIYTEDPLFSLQKEIQQSIDKEKKRILDEDSSFLVNLEDDSLLSWYLPLRKLVNSVSSIAQFQTEEIPTAIKSFGEIDYTDPRLYKSGLLKDVIEKHLWLIENSGQSMDAVYAKMNIAIDSILKNLWSDEKKSNQIIEFIFNFLEKRSLFKSSEYLALKVLNQNAYSINNALASKLESYRKMKIGNIGPDFVFEGDIVAPGYAVAPKRLSHIPTQYTVLVFGSSWCPSCAQELLQITRFYEDWKKHSIEVVFISLDEDEEVFKNFVNPFPFISINDYKKWKSPAIEGFYVFATPTIFLLDNRQEILLRPSSAKQLDLWFDRFLNGN